jgi:hypothetical protein
MEAKRLYSVEFIDDEGESILKHQIMTPSEAEKLIEIMRKNRIFGTICDLSAPLADTPLGVLSSNGQ